MTFLGSGFLLRYVGPTEQIIAPILAFSDSARAFIPQTGEFPALGWYQGAAGAVGAGRLAVFGEAGMFTAQVDTQGRRFGMNRAEASQNPQFVLNVTRWLSGVVAER